jgi:hypothetical protein
VSASQTLNNLQSTAELRPVVLARNAVRILRSGRPTGDNVVSFGVCQHSLCGKTLRAQKTKPPKYCGATCRIAHSRLKVSSTTIDRVFINVLERKCLWCGKSFPPLSKGPGRPRRYCSRAHCTLHRHHPSHTSESWAALGPPVKIGRRNIFATMVTTLVGARDVDGGFKEKLVTRVVPGFETCDPIERIPLPAPLHTGWRGKQVARVPEIVVKAFPVEKVPESEVKAKPNFLWLRCVACGGERHCECSSQPTKPSLIVGDAPSVQKAKPLALRRLSPAYRAKVRETWKQTRREVAAGRATVG